MKKTEECKAIITVDGNRYETVHLRLDNMHVIDNSFHIDGGSMWFSFDTVDGYSTFYNNIRSKSLDKNPTEDVISNIEFCFFDKHTLIPRKEGKNGAYLLQDNIQIIDNKIIFNINFSGRGRFYFE